MTNTASVRPMKPNPKTNHPSPEPGGIAVRGTPPARGLSRKARAMETRVAWRVWFDEVTCLIVPGEDEYDARLNAQFQAWTVTDKWLHPIKVEAAV